MSKGPIWRDQVRRGVPHLHLFSEHVVRRPKDWPACGEVTGFCFLDAPAAWRPPAALTDFLAAGPKPVYVGFGSMTGMNPEKLATLTRDALRQSKQRAVIGMGWGGIHGFEASDDMHVVDDVPHDWLFPRVSAVAQHCGAGTTAAALRAGRPTVAVPFFADQTFWGQTLNDLGAAPPPVPKKKLTVARLAAAIAHATSEPRYAERSEAIGAAIRAEDGAARTAERALHHLARA
jgi:sterol 3beta-glucosyltransferase